MSIPTLRKDLRIIEKLSDLPNAADGLSAQALKEKFDEGALTIQQWLNETLVPALTAEQLPFSPSGEIAADTIQDAVELIHGQVRDAAAGNIVNGSVGKEKLSEALLERVYGGRVWVSLDAPGAQDDKAADFPVGQLWLQPGFTVENAAGSWAGVGCSVDQGENITTVTGIGAAVTAAVTQALAGLGREGDRVCVLFDIREKDPEISSLTLTVNGGETRTADTGGVFFANLLSGGTLTIQLTAAWPSISLAEGSFQIGNFAVVNLDAVCRQNPDAWDKADWGGYLQSILPIGVHDSPETVWMHTENGTWHPMAEAVFPVTRGGTGHSTVAPGDLLVGGGNNTLQKLAAPSEDGAVLQIHDGLPVWADRETAMVELGALRMTTGTYTGTGEVRELTLPVRPKLLAVFPQSGPAYSTNYGYRDNPVILPSGAVVGVDYHVENQKKSATLALSENLLKFDGNAQAGNRPGEAYTWLAIY